MNKRLTKREREQEKAEAKRMLLKFLKPGDTVLSTYRSHSRTGLNHTMDFYVVNKEAVLGQSAAPQLTFLSGYIATLHGYRRTQDGALISSNDAFSVVLNLSYALWGVRPLDTRNTGEPHLREERI